MKLNRILPVAGVLTLLAGAALAQNIPAGAGAGVYRPPPGARVGHTVNSSYGDLSSARGGAAGLRRG